MTVTAPAAPPVTTPPVPTPAAAYEPPPLTPEPTDMLEPEVEAPDGVPPPPSSLEQADSATARQRTKAKFLQWVIASPPSTMCLARKTVAGGVDFLDTQMNETFTMAA